MNESIVWIQNRDDRGRSREHQDPIQTARKRGLVLNRCPVARTIYGEWERS